MDDDPQNVFAEKRKQMVDQQLKKRGIRDPRVLAAMATVPRHVFVPDTVRYAAYEDTALPIGCDQTISQPYVVALMLEAAQIQPSDRVLEIGTGSGYSAAVTSRLAREVFTIERYAELATAAVECLQTLDYKNIHVLQTDGSEGWPAAAPYDVILITAAAPEIPQPLIEQLADGGRLVAPIGDQQAQTLLRLQRHGDQIQRQDLTNVRFVPLIGKYGWKNINGEDSPS